MSAGLPPNMRIVTVPNGQPQTKPRALNYALQDARGMLVAVYDAEDIPDADQLRRAANAFIEGGPRLACVQARLAIYNADKSFLSRQFALEYSALFRGLLPALGFLSLPIPLGGTSNHFRRDLLLKIGGWDPFNVTEDADLGIRLARFGYEVSVIDPRRWRRRRRPGALGGVNARAGSRVGFRLTLSTCATRCVSGAISARGDLPAFN